jgi:hypothetical protein
MELTIPVTQLRTNISRILKRLREDPGLVYRITHHKEVIAEMRAPSTAEGGKTDVSTAREIATFIETFLQGGVPKKKDAYQRIRQLCMTPSDQVPYTTLEDAMNAIRNRNNGPS